MRIPLSEIKNTYKEKEQDVVDGHLLSISKQQQNQAHKVKEEAQYHPQWVLEHCKWSRCLSEEEKGACVEELEKYDSKYLAGETHSVLVRFF